MKHFGPTILDVFFKPYTKKVWTVEPSKMSPNWVGTRVAKLPQEKLEELCAMSQEELSTADFGWGPNSCFTFPKYGGTGNVWNSMAKKLPENWFKYSTKVVGIDATAKCIRYRVEGSNDVHEMNYDVLLNAAPIDILVRETKLCPEINVAYNKASYT
ncbi:unnamed protein product [Haemonchus placei]|uniref:Amino_oxidase domain-containing protein n=1 Tax=Haemonchus placei TaxID=6290 RepID=A0A0N4VYS3_HAEPC|nr:unnamed protein product [Haemonchus placei]